MDDEETFEETKKCRKCRMDIPVDAEKCPYCRSSQKAISGFKVFIWIVLFALTGCLAWYGITQYKINGVKNGYLSEYSKKVTVGEALDSFLGNPKWKYEKDNTGSKVVSVTGECTYDNKPAEVKIQFSILNEGKYFSMTGMRLNGQDLGMITNLVFAALYTKAVESYR